MVEVGQLAIKTAGRDAGLECLVVDKLKDGLVMIDGNTRRRKCSLKHLDLQEPVAKIKKNADHSEVVAALKSLGIGVIEKKKATYEKKPRKGKSEKKEKKKIFKKKEAKAKVKKEAKPKK